MASIMKICIGGFTSSGKTTLGEALSKELGIRHINPSYKNMVKNDEKKVIGLLDDLMSKKDRKVAEDFDAEVAKMSNEGDCVVSTWIGSWIVKDATARVWLNASQETRATRRAKAKGMDTKEALEFIKAYDRKSADYFKGVYGIDVTDHSIFDMELNTEKLSINDMVGIVSLLAAQRDTKRFR